MAKLIRIEKFMDRKKKWQHFKLQTRRYILRLSILTNLGFSIYLAHEHGYLTNYYRMVRPILETILTKLPL
jgi:hypothetical protein